MNKGRIIENNKVVCDPPLVMLDQLEALETDIQSDLKELRATL